MIMAIKIFLRETLFNKNAIIRNVQKELILNEPNAHINIFPDNLSRNQDTKP